MLIEELTAGQNISIQVIMNAEQMEFPTTVIDPVPKRHGIYASPIMRGDKVVSFRGKGILTHLIVTFPDTKPQIFYNVIIQTMKSEDGSFSYLISTLSPSMAYNRRNAFRCFLGISSSVQVGMNNTAVDAVIRDVSLTGFSFVISSDEKQYADGSAVHILLNDHIDEKQENFSFHLFGIIVRSLELENNKTMYGCKLTNKIHGLERYIMLKERLRLNKSRNVG